MNHALDAVTDWLAAHPRITCALIVIAILCAHAIEGPMI